MSKKPSSPPTQQAPLTPTGNSSEKKDDNQKAADPNNSTAGKKRGSHPAFNEKVWVLKDVVDAKARKNKMYNKDMEKTECAVVCIGQAPKLVKLVDVIKENVTTKDTRIHEIVPESFEVDNTELAKTREEMDLRDKFRELEKEKLVVEVNMLKQRVSYLETVVEEQNKIIAKTKQVESDVANALTLYNTKMKDLKNAEKKNGEALHDFKNKYASRLKL